MAKICLKCVLYCINDKIKIKYFVYILNILTIKNKIWFYLIYLLYTNKIAI